MNSDINITELNDQMHLNGRPFTYDSRESRVSKNIYRHAVATGKITPLTKEEIQEPRRRPYVKVEIPHGGLRYPKSTGRGRSAFKYGPMTQTQKDKVIESMNFGVGKATACQQVGANLQMFAKAYKEDENFRNAVNLANAIIDETLDSVVQIKALEQASSSDAMALRRLRLEIKNRERGQTLERRKIKQKDRELDIKEKSCGAIVDQVKSQLYLRVLSHEELERYDYLANNLKALSLEEKVEYADIMAKVTSSPDDPMLMQSNGQKMLNGVARIEQEFSEDEDEE